MELVLIAALAVALAAGLSVTLLVLGAMAFVRTERLKRALLDAHRRIEDLEHGRSVLPAEGLEPRPAAPPPPPAPPSPDLPQTEQAAKPERFVRLPDPIAGVERAQREPADPAAEGPSFRIPRFKPPIFAMPEMPEVGAPRFDMSPDVARRVAIGAGVFAALALALVTYAQSAGAIPPVAQVALLGLLGFGGFVGADSLGRLGRGLMAQGAAILAAAALAGAVLYAGEIWGRDPLRLVPSAAGVLSGLTGVAVLLLLLAPRHGALLGWAGLALGLAAPLARFADISAYALFSSLLLLAAVVFAVALIRPWRRLSAVAAVGVLAWAYVFVWFGLSEATQSVGAGFFVALTALSIAAAWEPAREAPQLSADWARRLTALGPVALAHVVAFASAIGVALILAQGGYDVAPTMALVVLTGGLALVASLREGFAFGPLALAPIAMVALAFWPYPDLESTRAVVRSPSLFFAACGAFGLAFSACGGTMMARNSFRLPGALLAAMGPPAVLAVAYAKAGAHLAPYSWGAAALVVTAINFLILDRLVSQRAREFVGPGAAFAQGGVVAIVCGAFFALQGLYLSLALALVAPLLAALDRRYDLPALKLAAGGVAALALWRLAFSFEPLRAEVSPMPLLNELTLVYGLAILAFWGASRLFDRIEGKNDALLVQGLEAGALLLCAALLSLQVRHLVNGGDLDAPYETLAEFAGHTLVLLAFAGALAWKFGARPRPLLFWAEAVAFGAALLHAAIAGLVLLNPWWGSSPGRIAGPPVADTLLLAYGATAVLLLGYAMLRRRQGLLQRALLADLAAIGAGFLYVTLEVRRLFYLDSPAEMASAPISPPEAWALTAAWIVFALALLCVGVLRRRPLLRILSLIPLTMALGKGFFIDAPALTGPSLILAYIALGLALGAAGLLYHRLLFLKPLGPEGLAGLFGQRVPQ